MTNTLLLEMAIRRAKLTKKEAAQRLGLSVMGLYQKINNVTEFKAGEINQLYKMLNLSTLEEQQQNFFLLI